MEQRECKNHDICGGYVRDEPGHGIRTYCYACSKRYSRGKDIGPIKRTDDDSVKDDAIRECCELENVDDGKVFYDNHPASIAITEMLEADSEDDNDYRIKRDKAFAACARAFRAVSREYTESDLSNIVATKVEAIIRDSMAKARNARTKETFVKIAKASAKKRWKGHHKKKPKKLWRLK
jgi:hypothetical protein